MTVEVAAPAVLLVLLVAGDGRARSDADLGYRGGPEVPGVRWPDPASGRAGGVELDLDQVPAEVERVLVVAGLAGGASFGQFAAPVTRVDDAATPPGDDGGAAFVAEYAIAGLGPESAVITVEAYRRGGGWKLRAFGQGYADGLVALGGAHGISSRTIRSLPTAGPTSPRPGAGTGRADALTDRADALLLDPPDDPAAAVSASGLPLGWPTDWASWRQPTRPELVLNGDVDDVPTIAFGTLDGHPVIAAATKSFGADAVFVWDATTGDELSDELIGHVELVLDAVHALAFGIVDDRPVLFAGVANGTVARWDVRTGTTIDEPLTGHTGAVRSVAFGHLDGRPVIASGGADRVILVRDAATGAPIGQPLTGHTGAVRSLAFGHLDGRAVIASGSVDATVRRWDAATGTPIGAPLTGHTGRVFAVLLGVLDGRLVVVSGGDDRTVRIHDARGGALIGKPLAAHTDAVLSLAWGDLDGRTVLATGGRDHRLIVWDPADAAPIGELAHFHEVTSIAMGAVDGRPVIVYGRNAVLARDLADLVASDEPLHHDGDVNAVAFGTCGDRELVATCGRDLTVRLWDATTGAPVGQPLVGHTEEPFTAQFETWAEKPTLLTVGGDGLRGWDPATGAALAGRANPTWQPPMTLGPLDDTLVCAVGQADYRLALYDLRRPTEPLHPPLVGHFAKVRAVAFGVADGRRIVATGSDDNTVRRWDVASGNPLGGPIAAHVGPVWGVAFGYLEDSAHLHPVLVTCGADQAVRLWEPTTGTALGTADDPYRARGWELPAQIDFGVPVYGVACSPPPGPIRLAVATASGTVILRLPEVR